ncbi:MAG: segregation/condensation protein A [Firmicutes bacterium]|nr:segregation/condensation protein A [Bacillota bacterium]
MKSLTTQEKRESRGHCYIVLPVFEGPFDLLFYLVNKEELDIHEIPLAKITRQYLQHLQTMQELQVEVAGEFLVMAASLLRLKSRLLLPHPPSYLNAAEEEEMLLFGSKEELVQSLLEYKRYKEAAAILQRRADSQERIFLRVVVPNHNTSHKKLNKPDPAGLENLKEAWLKLKEKNKRAEQPPGTIFFAPKISFVRVLRWVVASLRKNTFFNSYLDDFGTKGTKEERVTIFMLFLELARRGRLSLGQNGFFGRIRILKPNHKGGEES